jgi:hypothetical protein
MPDEDKTPWWAFNRRKVQENIERAGGAFDIAVNGEPGDLARYDRRGAAPGDSKFCSACGKPVAVNANYCGACGAAQ